MALFQIIRSGKARVHSTSRVDSNIMLCQEFQRTGCDVRGGPGHASLSLTHLVCTQDELMSISLCAHVHTTLLCYDFTDDNGHLCKDSSYIRVHSQNN